MRGMVTSITPRGSRGVHLCRLTQVEPCPSLAEVCLSVRVGLQ